MFEIVAWTWTWTRSFSKIVAWTWTWTRRETGVHLTLFEGIYNLTRNCLFFVNRKQKTLEPEVETISFELMDFYNGSTIFVLLFFKPGSHKNHFPSMYIYSYIGGNIFQKSLALSLVKTLKNCTFFSSNIFLTSGAPKIVNFPVMKFRPEVEKYPIRQPESSCIYPQSFMKIGPPVQEKIACDT